MSDALRDQVVPGLPWQLRLWGGGRGLREREGRLPSDLPVGTPHPLMSICATLGE